MDKEVEKYRISHPREYWNDRTKEYRNDLRGLIWHSGYTLQHDAFVRHILKYFKNKKVLDVGCGYGRFAPIFKKQNYLGFDVSDEMVKLANEKNPGYRFEQRNYNEQKEERYDLVFQVISLGPMGVSEEQFFADFKDKADIIISFGAEDFNCKYYPSKTDAELGLL